VTPVQDMEIFARIVTAGTMTAASRELGVSPAVVSKRIRRLEERLGARLFQRTTRQITLTESGQEYYRRVVAILASIDEAENAMSRGADLAQGILKISAPTTFGRLHIAPYLGKFMEKNPDLNINIALTDRFVDLVAEGVDMAIRIAELEDSSLVARRLAPNHRFLCASADYIKNHDMPETLDDLSKHNCLAATAQDVWRLEGPDGPVDIRVGGRLMTNSSEVVHEALLAGTGIALRSTWDVGPQLKQGLLKIILPEYQVKTRIGIYAVFPSREFLPIKVRLFIDYLAAIYGPKPYWDEGLDLEQYWD